MAVAQILKQKGRAVITVAPSQTLSDVAGILVKHRIGAVVVVDKAGAIAGIVSERDVVKALAGEAGKARNWSKYLRAPLSYYELFEGRA